MPATANDPFENMLAQMDRTEGYADVDNGIFERLEHPERRLKVTLPVDLDSGEVEALAGWMAWKTVPVDLPYGGANGGVICEPKGLTQNDLESLARRYTEGIRRMIGPGVDVLIPAAVEGVITADNVDDLRTSAIVEAANGPTTVAADEALTERDVQVVPDIPANAGGVIVSYLEWVQNAREFSWALETVNAELERRIGDAFDETIEQYDTKELPDLRTAAYTLAPERTAKAHEYRGLFP